MRFDVVGLHFAQLVNAVELPTRPQKQKKDEAGIKKCAIIQPLKKNQEARNTDGEP